MKIDDILICADGSACYVVDGTVVDFELLVENTCPIPERDSDCA